MKDIVAYLNCATCLEGIPAGISPQTYAAISVGVTKSGDLIVWCNRHETLVAHIPNDEISTELFKAASMPCSCGHCDKETAH